MDNPVTIKQISLLSIYIFVRVLMCIALHPCHPTNFFECHDYLITGHNLESFEYIHTNICDLLLGFQLQRKIFGDLFMP